MYTGLHVKYPSFPLDFNELEFPRQIFGKYSDVKLKKKSVQWQPSCSMRTDRHDEGKSLLAILRTLLKRIHGHKQQKTRRKYGLFGRNYKITFQKSKIINVKTTE